jgi:type IV pilus assembly protein PilM
MPMGWVERQLVSIDWDIRNLRVVSFTVRAKGDVRIRKVFSVAIPPEVSVGDPASFGQLLAEVLRREEIVAKRMVVDVPRDQAVLNTLRLPVVPADDLAAMVEFQIGKELPFPLAAAVTDYAVPDEPDEAGTQEVLVAAVRHEALEYYKQTAEVAGLKLERIGLRPYANKVAVNELLGDTRHERVLFVDVGPVLSEIDVLRDGKLVFSRAASVQVPRPPPSAAAPATEKSPSRLDLDLCLTGVVAEAVLPEQDRVVSALLREVALTIEAYRAGDPGADMNHVVVGGDTGLEEALLGAIRQRFEITGERYNPTACLGWDGTSGAAAGGFAAALGLALGHAGAGRLDFDFMHPKKAVPRSRRRLRKAPIAAAVVLLFCAAGAVAYVRVVGPKKQQIANLEKQVEKANAQLKEYKKFGEMMTKVEEFEREQIIWLDELADFLSVWPDTDQIVLSSIDLSQKEGLIQLKDMYCQDVNVADAARARLDAFRKSDDGPLLYDATLGGNTPQKDAYSVKASMTIEVKNRGGRAD